jgi:hypothetical protein
VTSIYDGGMKAFFVIAAAGLTAAAAAAAPGPRAAHTSEGAKLASSSLLRVSELGNGWTAEKVAGTATGINFSCQGFTPKQQDLVEIGTATSPNFKASAIGPFVVQKTSVYEDAATVETLWRRAVKPRLVECVAQSLQGLEDRGVRVTIDSKNTLPIGAMAKHSAAYRVVATLTTSKQRLKTYFDVVLLASRRAITELTISQFQKAPPLAWEQGLSKLAARRLGAGGPTA